MLFIFERLGGRLRRIQKCLPEPSKKSMIISTDMDFGNLLAEKELSRPSVILFRRVEGKTQARLALILKNLATIRADLEQGSVVIPESSRIRIRRLPMGKKDS